MCLRNNDGPSDCDSLATVAQGRRKLVHPVTPGVPREVRRPEILKFAFTLV